MTHRAEGYLALRLINFSEPAGKFPALCQHSSCSGLETVGNKHGEIGPPAAIWVMKGSTFKKGPSCDGNAVHHHRTACAPDLQEAAQVHVSPHAPVRSSLHGVHGSPLHRGDGAAVAGADAL